MVTVVLLLISAGYLALGWTGRPIALAAPGQPVPTSPAKVAPAAAATSPRTAFPRSRPVMLRIPAIDVAVSLTTLGLKPDGSVEVPTDFAQPGWFRLGPAPGQLGSAVILGHVDSFRGPAVFFRLGSLRAGDQVEVDLADGADVDFVVSSVASYPKSAFPASRVYGPHGGSALQLVTCGGVFDHGSHSYLSNVVVYTRLAALT